MPIKVDINKICLTTVKVFANNGIDIFKAVDKELLINVIVIIPIIIPIILDITERTRPSKSKETKTTVLGAPIDNTIVNSGILSKVVISIVLVEAIKAIDIDAIIIITCNIFILDIIVC